MVANLARVRTVVRVCVSVCVFVPALGLLLSLSAGKAHALEGDEADAARAYHEKAKAAFALSHYAQAAEFFEKAFEAKADPALLYNAAQSHRLAGNKERALTLYQNYLRVYGRDDKRAQIELRIEELKRAIDRDRREVPAPPPPTWPGGTPRTSPGAASADRPLAPPPAAAAVTDASKSPPPAAASPPVEPLAVGPSSSPSSPAPGVPSASSDSATATPPTLVSAPGAEAEDQRSITQKPWFWIAVGGGAAVVVAVVLVVALSGTKDPSGSFGQVNGN